MYYKSIIIEVVSYLLQKQKKHYIWKMETSRLSEVFKKKKKKKPKKQINNPNVL